MHTLDYRLIIGRIDIPDVWEELITMDFPEDLKGVKKGYAPNNNDPDPYYDDRRAITNDLRDGSTLYTILSSGQGNYWGEHEIDNDDLGFTDSIGPLASFNDTEEFDVRNRKYVLSVNWLK